MESKHKTIIIPAAPDKVFARLDDFSKTGMHMSESSMMMMGSKLTLEQLSKNSTGLGAKYRWFGKMMGMHIDFEQKVTKWEPPNWKEWQTTGDAQIIIMRWYRMGFEIAPTEQGSLVKLYIDYLPPRTWFFQLLSFLFAGWYCNWCLNNMLIDTKRAFESKKA